MASGGTVCAARYHVAQLQLTSEVTLPGHAVRLGRTPTSCRRRDRVALYYATTLQHVMVSPLDVAPAMYKRFKAGLAKHGLTNSGAKGE